MFLPAMKVVVSVANNEVWKECGGGRLCWGKKERCWPFGWIKAEIILGFGLESVSELKASVSIW